VYIKVSPMSGLQRFRYEANSHLGSLVCSRPQKREKKNLRQNFFFDSSKSRGRDSFKRGRFVTPQNFNFWNVTKIH
jgi:hypothetical protein